MPNFSSSVIAFVKDRALRVKPQNPPAAIRILVVDDEEPVRMFVERALNGAGYETVLAFNGPNALEVAGTIGPLDILVTDVMMPEMNGDELARRLRKERPALKVLYLTGYSDKLFKERAMLWQDEAFLDKPCGVKGLCEAVSLMLFGRLDAQNAISH